MSLQAVGVGGSTRANSSTEVVLRQVLTAAGKLVTFARRTRKPVDVIGTIRAV